MNRVIHGAFSLLQSLLVDKLGGDRGNLGLSARDCERKLEKEKQSRVMDFEHHSGNSADHK